MRQGKLFIIVVVVILIILVQPNVFKTVKQVLLPRSFSDQIVGKHEQASEQELNKILADKVFEGQRVIQVNNNVPVFTQEELSLKNDHWKKFSELDILNRVGQAEALISQRSLPKNERGDISSVRPTGWKNKQIIFNGEPSYLYNRCHLIAFSLSGENANPKNLFTGTRALNADSANETQSMVYYEKMIANYIRQTDHHVLYRVTPIFKRFDLVAKGVRMEAKSIEDDQIAFDIFIFNVQPGYKINYLDGTSVKEK